MGGGCTHSDFDLLLVTKVAYDHLGDDSCLPFLNEVMHGNDYDDDELGWRQPGQIVDEEEEELGQDHHATLEAVHCAVLLLLLRYEKQVHVHPYPSAGGAESAAPPLAREEEERGEVPPSRFGSHGRVP